LIPVHPYPGSDAAPFRPPRSGSGQGQSSHRILILSVARGMEVSRVRALTELRGHRVSVDRYVAPKGPVQCKRCQRFDHTAATLLGASRMCALISLVTAHRAQRNPCAESLGANTANYRGCVNWKDARADLEKRAPSQGRQTVATSHPTASIYAGRTVRRQGNQTARSSSHSGYTSRNS
jgi:hypothetical protein